MVIYYHFKDNEKIYTISKIDDLYNVKDFDKITFLEIESADIIELTKFPSKLEILHLYDNGLIKIENYPLTLTEFAFREKSLKNLTGLPAGLKYLYCPNSNLVSIEVPMGLRKLECYNNEITELKDLPILDELICDKNVKIISSANLNTLKSYVRYYK
jgi:hypothetical protein